MKNNTKCEDLKKGGEMKLSSWKVENKSISRHLEEVSSGKTFRAKKAFIIVGLRVGAPIAAMMMCPYACFEAIEVRAIPDSKNFLAVSSDGAECILIN